MKRLLVVCAVLISSDALLGQAPALETIRIDVTARAFATPNPENQAQVDEDLARLMLRSLLIDRFDIKWHMEDRPMPAYTLVAESPKMTKADPNVRTRCFEGAPPGSAAAGLQGGYDFTLNITPIELLQGARPELGAANTGQALDPTGGLSLMDAVRRQLGIRLEETKRPVPVLVIDSISETPKDN